MIDRNTGLAIYGFDPVAYFTDGRRKVGRAELELKHGGAAWRFRNEGNRAAFAEHPEIYMPRYGGHDPVAIGAAFARAGHPDFWAIHDKNACFCSIRKTPSGHSTPIPRITALQAEANWPHVQRDALAVIAAVKTSAASAGSHQATKDGTLRSRATCP